MEEMIGETNGRIDELQDVKGDMRALKDTRNYTRQTIVAVQSRLANLEQTNAGTTSIVSAYLLVFLCLAVCLVMHTGTMQALHVHLCILF